MRPRVCVLDEDGHRISLPRDECQSVAPFRTMSVKAFGDRPDEVCHGIWHPDDEYQGICLPDAECQAILLPDDECQGVCLPDDECQDIFLPDAECQGIYLPDADAEYQGICLRGATAFT
jgi:hypothetical protein